MFLSHAAMSQLAARQEKEKDNIIYYFPLLGKYFLTNISQIGLKPPASIGGFVPRIIKWDPFFVGVQTMQTYGDV